MPQHIGIIGVSPEGSSIFYRLLAHKIAEIADHARRPALTIHNIPFADYVDAIRADDWPAVGHHLATSAEVLARAGAGFCVLPDNATHHALPLAAAAAATPIVNMIEAVADAIERNQHKQIGLIGTKYVTFGSTYQTVLGLRGIKLDVPEHEDALEIDRIIFEEATKGDVREESVNHVTRVIQKLADDGCESVVLGASETTLLLNKRALPLPALDPLAILAEATLERAEKEAEVA